MRNLRSAIIGGLATLSLLVYACGDLEIDVRCEPLKSGALGCVGLPKEKPTATSAVYPVGCEVLDKREDRKDLYVCSPDFEADAGFAYKWSNPQ